MRRRTLAAERRPLDPALKTPLRFVLVTMDSHLSSACERARAQLVRQMPGLHMSLHAASEFAADAEALARCTADIASADIVVATMLFMEDHFKPVLEALQARREHCDAMVCAMSAGEVARLTRMGKFDMGKPASGVMALLKKLRGKAGSDSKGGGSGGEKQMRMLRRLPQLLRYIPGTAQDVRAYFLTLQYWLGGSQDNVANLVRFLIDRYAAGPREVLRGKLTVEAPVAYPETGVYHPRLASRMAEDAAELPQIVPTARAKGRVGLLLLRSYLLAGNARHYDGVIAALEVQGLQVVPAFAAGLDARPAIDRFFMHEGRATVDAVLSLTGFSLVGGPAYNDSQAAEEVLARLDVPYLAAHAVEFQSLTDWGASERGLLPVESTIMVAIPELDGATGPMVFGGRGGGATAGGSHCTGCENHCQFEAGEQMVDMHTCSERTAMIASRVAKLVALRRSERAERKLALVVFNFPPNAGNLGTAAHLSVFESVFETLKGLKAQGYTVEIPASVDALRESLLVGNAQKYGADANVHALIPAADHVRRERWLKPIEAAWGPAPGRQLSDGRNLFVLGLQLGNVLVAVQPGMGYEGDPMRLLFEKGFAPTHAFSAFYRYLREDWKAHAVLHFGTHGALEFMPGKQAGLTGNCWPDRLIADLPNFYLYASNNPSEGAIAKRRAAATLISYLTPPVAEAGLYRGLIDLKASLQRWRALDPEAGQERADLEQLLQAQAAVLELCAAEPAWGDSAGAHLAHLADQVLELEYTLIPHGLHVVGRVPSAPERADLLMAMSESDQSEALDRRSIEALVAGATPEQALDAAGRPHNAGALERLANLAASNALLAVDSEIAGILRALDGRFVPPAPGGDVMRNPQVLPTGRNLHGFDPFRIPSAFAVRDAQRQTERLLERHAQDGHGLPETVALVLWGTDNLKTEGTPLAQALALMGAAPRFDSYGRLAGASLVPLEELGRPRIDVVMTLSGIFRDLLPLQIRMLAEASFLAASADEPEDQNYVRKHALAWQREQGCDLETAALRVFGNADGAYGANVNMLIDNGAWQEEDELAETYTRRKGFAYGRAGKPVKQHALLNHVLQDVALAFQNLDSVELGVTTIDTYFDTLGGISRAVQRAKKGANKDADTPVYIGDQSRAGASGGTVRTLSEQVALETRTRMLNPKWYEGMLEHGYEGVRQIEVHLTNTMGWSATTGQVQPWVYKQLTETFVLDPAMRERLARLNPTASAKVANRLLEASDRNYWQPDAATLAALKSAGEELEDRLEGVFVKAAA
jgi:magnesium chelatase subunit H